MSIYTNETIQLSWSSQPEFEIEFSDGLNLLVGENGTCKTKILELLLRKKENRRVYGFSPKRNTIAQELKQAISEVNKKQKTKEQSLSEFASISKILPVGFSEYPSFTELFFLRARPLYDTTADGLLKKDAYAKILQEFNSVVQQVFTKIELVLDESDEDMIRVKKNDAVFSVQELSTGESQLISLIINLDYLKGSYDIFLVDEPEVHLNWSLEKALFDYLNNFAVRENKQIIVATHSRLVFQSPFKEKSTFLSLLHDVIQVSKDPNREITNALAGEAVQYIDSYLLDFKNATQKTAFVEDEFQEAVLKLLAPDIHIIQCGDRDKVINMIKLLNKLSGEDGKYIGLIDGDNKPDPGIDNLRQLKKYCAESYFLDSCVLVNVLDKAQDVLGDLISSHLKKSSDRAGVFKYITDDGLSKKYLDFYPDPKELLNNLVDFNWKTDKEERGQFISQYIQKASDTAFDEFKNL